jgi:hypothetical protein
MRKLVARAPCQLRHSHAWPVRPRARASASSAALRSTRRAGCAGFYAGARHTVWREAARVLPRVAAAEPSPCSLDAGCAGFYAGARHGVARGGTCAASGGGRWAAALLARCGLRWLLRWRAPRCGERRGTCAASGGLAAAELSPCSLLLLRWTRESRDFFLLPKHRGTKVATTSELHAHTLRLYRTLYWSCLPPVQERGQQI